MRGAPGAPCAGCDRAAEIVQRVVAVDTPRAGVARNRMPSAPCAAAASDRRRNVMDSMPARRVSAITVPTPRQRSASSIAQHRSRSRRTATTISRSGASVNSSSPGPHGAPLSSNAVSSAIQMSVRRFGKTPEIPSAKPAAAAMCRSLAAAISCSAPRARPPPSAPSIGAIPSGCRPASSRPAGRSNFRISRRN